MYLFGMSASADVVYGQILIFRFRFSLHTQMIFKQVCIDECTSHSPLTMDKSKLRLIKSKRASAAAAAAAPSQSENLNPPSDTSLADDSVKHHDLTTSEPEDTAPAHENIEDAPIKTNHSYVEEGVKSCQPEAATRTSGPVAKKWAVKWSCGECGNTCIPIRSESRCLCGHRYKEHKASSGDSAGRIRFSCSSRNCACKHFFFVVAEGAWILRCRCKHKHIEHDCSKKPFICKKPKCQCVGFDR